MGTGTGPHDPSIINFDLLSHPVFNRVYHGMWETRLPVMSEVTDLDFFYGGAIRDNVDHPHSFLMHPVYPFSPDFSYAVDDLGFVVAILPWDTSPTSSPRVSTAWWLFFMTRGDHYTYQLDGPDAIFPEKVTSTTRATTTWRLIQSSPSNITFRHPRALRV
jgi:hypothetical protein